jgi:hypothetical protein
LLRRMPVPIEINLSIRVGRTMVVVVEIRRWIAEAIAIGDRRVVDNDLAGLRITYRARLEVVVSW